MNTIIAFPTPTAQLSRLVTISAHGFFQDSSWFPRMAEKLGMSVAGMTQHSGFLSLHTDFIYTVLGTVDQFHALNCAMADKYRQDAEDRRRADQIQIDKLQRRRAGRPFKAVRSILSKLGGPDMQAGIAALASVSLLLLIPATLALFAIMGIIAGTIGLALTVAATLLIRIALLNQDDLSDLRQINDLQD